jgi:hypothetical protein
MVSEEKYLELEKEFGIKGWKVEVANDSRHSERSEESLDSSIVRTSLNLNDHDTDKKSDTISNSPLAISQKFKLSA